MSENALTSLSLFTIHANIVFSLLMNDTEIMEDGHWPITNKCEVEVLIS